MSAEQSQRRFFCRTPPRAAVLATGAIVGVNVVPGSILALPITTAAGVLSLQGNYNFANTTANYGTGAPALVPNLSAYTAQTAGLQGSQSASIRLMLQAVGVTVGIISGAVVADVSGTNAPVLATQGTLSAGVTGLYTPAAGTCWQMIPGQASEILEFECSYVQDLWLGFVGSSSGSLLIFQVSGAGA